MNKRLIALMCSSVITLSALSLTGCGSSEDMYSNTPFGEDNIVLDFNGNAVLHKRGEAEPSPYVRSRYSNFDDYTFACGEKVTVNSNLMLSHEDIPKKYYDEVCTGCFSEEEIERLSK